jgi:ketosteroid isomerase-like protein
MKRNKEVVQQYMDGFNAGDHAKILECLTENIVWDMPGLFHLSGKEAFDKEIENDNFEGKPTVSIIRLIEENNIVVAEGTVQCKIRAGGILDAMFCDVFQMERGKIKQLTTYQMNK